MGVLEEILEKISMQQYEFSKHAVDQGVTRDIRTAEMEQTIRPPPHHVKPK